jgi:methylglutaconyl-CoA hydratase
MSETVTATASDGIGTITFGHPKGNSLPGALLRRLAETVSRMGADGAVRVIVLRSEGTGPFCAGASFDELSAIADAETGTEFFMGFARLILAMIRCPQFVLTRVQGKAVGGGVGVLAASDYAIGTSDVAVRLSELAVGIGPFVVGPVIERRIGPAAYAQLSIDASGWRNADWALARGLLAEVAGTVRELDERVDVLAQRLAASNPEAMQRLKRIFWGGTEQWPALLEERARMSGTLVLSDYTRQAITAFRTRA